MSVKLRTRKASKGRIRYYLDITLSKTNRSQETLFYVNPGDDKIEKKKLAEEIKRQRELEIISKGTEFIPKHKKNLKAFDYFDDYLKEYSKKDFRTMEAVIIKFKDFMKNDHKLLLKDITEKNIKDFIDYLNTKANLKGETPKSYYRRFKKCLNNADDENLIDDKIFKKVKFKGNKEDGKTLKKEILTEDEIKILFDTECGNTEVKRAFLFACYSGLGLAEIKALTWYNIKNDRLIDDRKKTSTQINIKLSSKAINLLGERKENDDLIFDFSKNGKVISDTAINKNLNNWVKRANINKKITFYCGRHTFAIRLLTNGANLKVVADALAHTSTNHTIKYLNYVDSLKDDATTNLD